MHSQRSASLEKVLRLLERLSYPNVQGVKSLKDKETRVSVLEWLLQRYDGELWLQCEGLSRTGRVARQLHVLGLGGSKLPACEAFLLGQDERTTLAVVTELCQLLEHGPELASLDLVEKDVEMPKKVAKKSRVYFEESFVLFPPKLLEAARTDERIDTAALMSELSSLHERLTKAINGFKAKSNASFVENPSVVPELAAQAKSLARALQRFNAMYQEEISHWKVESMKPNVELGVLVESVYDKFVEWNKLLDAYGKISGCCESVAKIGSQVDHKLGSVAPSGPQIASEEFVANTETLITKLK